MGLGDVHEVRRRLEEAKLRYDHQVAQIKEQQAAGLVDESAYQKLYELDVAQKKLERHLEEAEAKQAEAGTGEASGAHAHRRLLRQEVGPEEIAEVVSAWTGIPVSRMMETERAT